MAFDQTKRLKPSVLKKDADAFAAIKTLTPAYAPSDTSYTAALMTTAQTNMGTAQGTEVTKKGEFQAARDAANAAEWAFHNLVIGARDQVRAQYGEDFGPGAGDRAEEEVGTQTARAAPAEDAADDVTWKVGSARRADRRSRRERPTLHELAGVEDAAGVEGALHGAMQVAHFPRDRQRPPALFGEADAVLAGDRAAPRNDLLEKLVQRPLAALLCPRLLEGPPSHWCGCSRRPHGRSRRPRARASFEAARRNEEVLQPAAWHDDVFVELGEAGVAQGVEELAANLPDLSHSTLPRPTSTKRGFWGAMSRCRSRSSPRTERGWPSSSTMRWARQPRRRSLPVRLKAAASVKESAAKSLRGAPRIVAAPLWRRPGSPPESISTGSHPACRSRLWRLRPGA